MPLSMADAKIQARQQLARKGGKAKDVDALARKLMNRSSGTAEYNAPSGQTPVKMVTRGGDSVQVPSGGRQGNLSNYIDKVLEIGGEFAPRKGTNTGDTTGLSDQVATIPQDRPDGGGNPQVTPANPDEIGPLAPGYSWSEILAGTAGVAALYAAYRYLKQGGQPPANPDAVLTPGDKANDPMKTDPVGTSDAAGQAAEQRGLTTRAATSDEIAAARRMRPNDVATAKPADIVDAEWEPIKDLPALEQQTAIAEIRASHGGTDAANAQIASPEVQRLLTDQTTPPPPRQITDTKALTDQRSPDAKAQSSVEGTGDPAVRPNVPRDNINATIDEQVGADLSPQEFESVASRAASLDPAAQRSYINTQNLSEGDLARLIERLTGKTGRLIPKGR